jgi:hypothetical protein
MDPTTLVMERLAAEWAALMVALGSLAFWGGLGLVVLMVTTVVLATLLTQPEAASSDKRGPVVSTGVHPASLPPPSEGAVNAPTTRAGRLPVDRRSCSGRQARDRAGPAASQSCC